MTSPKVTAKRAEVRNLVEMSYPLVAPKSLLKKRAPGQAE